MSLRRVPIRIVVGVILAALVSPVFAGGWATVTLDAVPDAPTAGTALTLGFTVRQHGVTPIDKDPFEGGPLKPVLSAHNQSTDETLTAAARKDGPVGHFVVDVTFTSAGAWDIEITPPPFAGTQLAPLTILPAPAQAAKPKANAVVAPAPSPAVVITPAAQPSAAPRWTLPALALVVALGLTLALVTQRRSLAARLQRTAAHHET